MIDYARISKMLEYQQKDIWPLGPHDVRGRLFFLTRLMDIVRILLDYSPVVGVYGKRYREGGKDYSAFRMGTRGWEYPWALEQLSSLTPGAEVLDCGCGASRFPEELWRRGYKPSGLDFFIGPKSDRPGYGISNSHIKALRGRVTFLDGGMQDIPAPDRTFDAVTCISVMEHVVIEHRHNPSVHLRCLDEMKRVLKPGGLLICTYDTILNVEVVYGGTQEWGPQGWYYLDDIDYLQMRLRDADARRITREDVLMDDDAFFVPPDLYFRGGYGTGFECFGPYHRLTSIGFVLVKS